MMDKILIWFGLLMIGFGVGQWYRIAQVEPIYQRQVSEIRANQSDINLRWLDHETRLRKIEGRLVRGKR